MKKLIPYKANHCIAAVTLTSFAVLLFGGCAVTKDRVFATTATVIGVQIHQKDADKTPELKIGYARAELAIVPTDKGGEDSCCYIGSATNSAEVLMEINAEGSLALGSAYQGGIYQRLAVGRTAVQQPGAAFMMAKDKAGNIDKNTAAAVSKTLEGSYFKDDAGEKLRAFWKPDGNVNAANAAKLTAWMTANGLDANAGITMFLRLKEYAPMRSKAVQDLGLGN